MSRTSAHYVDRAGLRELMAELAPAAPPCFRSRDQWIEFLVAAQEDHAIDNRRIDAGMRFRRAPLDFRHSGGPRFNRDFDFCVECMAKHALAMQNEGRCHPMFLLRIEVAAA